MNNSAKLRHEVERMPSSLMRTRRWKRAVSKKGCHFCVLNKGYKYIPNVSLKKKPCAALWSTLSRNDKMEIWPYLFLVFISNKSTMVSQEIMLFYTRLKEVSHHILWPSCIVFINVYCPTLSWKYFISSVRCVLYGCHVFAKILMAD